jgi:hypothetical protein
VRCDSCPGIVHGHVAVAVHVCVNVNVNLNDNVCDRVQLGPTGFAPLACQAVHPPSLKQPRSL